VVWVANLKSLKQPEIFIKLAQDLEGLTTAKFLMIGEMQATHKERTYLEELLRGTKNLSYLGRLPQGEVNKILAESHLLVNTSLWEGFSNTFIQAWMRRVPVISLNVNPDNIFEARMLGLHSGSYEQLKLDVIRLLNDDKLRERMGLYSQAYSFENHSENNVKKIISIFNSFNYL
jgi:glycosyltransferase involved in cell wall biosynthesis